jgi:cellobiose phosphorylase
MSRKFENPLGYFAEDGREYIITTPFTPRPWVNVISNGDYGMLVSQNGSGYSWRGNAAQNRITRSFQDLIKDNWGKYFYIRDLNSSLDKIEGDSALEQNRPWVETWGYEHSSDYPREH